MLEKFSYDNKWWSSRRESSTRVATATISDPNKPLVLIVDDEKSEGRLYTNDTHSDRVTQHDRRDEYFIFILISVLKYLDKILGHDYVTN